jgi:hypothetical protein
MAATFIGGPARGSKMYISRYPVFLRVVHNPDTYNIDALDQLDDEVRDGEHVHIYQRIKYGFVCARGVGGDSDEFAEYDHLEVSDDVRRLVRDNEEWRKWVDALEERN